ncbi:MAG: hypothetical protein NZ529_09730 [Cytophagaceae bacterium]|nr:hypothetical protein [Cytophagaceae bacterium]MDW8457066.1 hypothetical protein [Cytophagaceae bacterium]
MIRYFLCINFFLSTIISHGQHLPLGSPINTALSDEFNVVLSGNGKTMIFEYKHMNEEKSQIMISYFKNGTWTVPQPLSGANSDVKNIYNGSFSLNYNGNIIMFSSSRYPGIGQNDIWMMEKTIIGSWTAPQNIGRPVNSAAHEMYPNLSPDGKWLYFTRMSDKKTPSGNSCGKIWIAEKTTNGWKAPVEMPASINRGCVCNARLLPDSRTLLFSSYTEGSSQGYDFYISQKDDTGSWSEPISLNTFNTSGDDIHLSVPAGNLAYYSIKGKSSFDITRSKIPESLSANKIYQLTGVVKKANDNLLIMPKIIYTNLQNNTSCIVQGGADGTYSAPFVCGYNYDVCITANENGYSFYSTILKLDKLNKYEERKLDIIVEKLRPGLIIPLNNISFKNNTDTLDEYSLPELNRIYQLLKTNITLRVEIGVHTDKVQTDTVFRNNLYGTITDTLGTYIDSTGKEQYKVKITYTSDNTSAQAKAISEWLHRKGIPYERIIPKGYSTSEPINGIPSKRVEMKVIHE